MSRSQIVEADTWDSVSQYTSRQMCMASLHALCYPGCSPLLRVQQRLILVPYISVQVNIPAESGEMGVLANHVPSIEQLKPGLVEVIEESGGSKQFFCKQVPSSYFWTLTKDYMPGS